MMGSGVGRTGAPSAHNSGNIQIHENQRFQGLSGGSCARVLFEEIRS